MRKLGLLGVLMAVAAVLGAACGGSSSGAQSPYQAGQAYAKAHYDPANGQYGTWDVTLPSNADQNVCDAFASKYGTDGTGPPAGQAYQGCHDETEALYTRSHATSSTTTTSPSSGSSSVQAQQQCHAMGYAQAVKKAGQWQCAFPYPHGSGGYTSPNPGYSGSSGSSSGIDQSPATPNPSPQNSGSYGGSESGGGG